MLNVVLTLEEVKLYSFLDSATVETLMLPE